MKFLIVITVPPYGSPVLFSALLIAEAVLKAEHELNIFLYGDGVWNASKNINPALDEFQPLKKFIALSKSAKLYYCISAAARRGVSSENAADCFLESSLGELAAMTAKSDRIIVL